MSADSATQFDILGDLRGALKAVRALRGEYDEFFSGVFSRLESVSGTVTTRQQARDRQLDELRRRQQDWEQERAVLERELEAVRNRAAELSETLAQQKRDAQLQQDRWAEEFKRMRRTLQQMARRLAEPSREPGVPTPDSPPLQENPPRPANAADPVLDSVMAQFEILQNDAAQRRKSAKVKQSKPQA